MILSTQSKVCLFMVPRTGTTTIRGVFAGKEIISAHELGLGPHPNYTDLSRHVRDLRSYRLFAFYRDPVERFISMVNYLIGVRTKNFSFKSLRDLLNSSVYLTSQGLFRPMLHWFGHPGVIPLDFSRYEEMLKMVLGLFNIEPPASIERNNESVPLWMPTKTERRQIAGLYCNDYKILKFLRE